MASTEEGELAGASGQMPSLTPLASVHSCAPTSAVDITPSHGHQCTICLDDEGTVVQKGCCCRGDAGAVHIACLIELAAHAAGANSDRRPWRVCSVCKTGYTGEAQLELARARKTASDSLPLTHPERLHAMSCLCNALHAYGQYREAEAIEVQVLEAHRKAHGPEHPSTLVACNNLAITYMSQGKYAEAVAMQREVIQVYTSLYGPTHQNTLEVSNDLGSTLRAQGKPAEAAELQKEVLAARRESLGPEHPDTLITAGNLAHTLNTLGRYAEAAELDRFVLASRTRVLGPDHPHTLVAAGNLAGRYKVQGEYPEAIQMERQVLAARMRVLGERHADTLIAMGNLGFTLTLQGEYVESEQLLRKAWVLDTDVFGPANPDTLIDAGHLSVAMREQGRFEEATALAEATLELARGVFAPEHRFIHLAVARVATTALFQGKAAVAEPMLRSAVEGLRAISGDNDTKVLQTSVTHGSALSDLGRNDEAVALLRDALTRQTKVLNAQHPSALRTSSVLGLALWRQGAQLAELQDLVSDGGGSASAAESLKEEGLAMLTNAHATQRRLFGPDHAQTRRSANRLVTVVAGGGGADGATEHTSIAAGSDTPVSKGTTVTE